MAVQQNEHQQSEHHHQQNHSFLLDALYCEEEEQWEEEEEEEELVQEGLEEERDSCNSSSGRSASFLPLLLLEQDLFWEDEELLSLFSKEQEIHFNLGNGDTASALSLARKEAVEWILKVNGHYGFTVLTAILAINYLDRSLASLHFQTEKPWMIQLAAVTCLSLAAKVEETQVPLLLDLQMETKYAFEAKTIQRMELLVLSTLQWRMNPVTPLSFLDHIIRRLGLKTHLHWEFLRRCERLLLSVVSDSRSVGYLPSVLATATMLHGIHQVEPGNSIQYQNQLLSVLKLNREKVNDCYQLILELSSTSSCFYKEQSNPHKRKHQQVPSSPSGVIDASFGSDSSNEQPLFKKSRAQEKQLHVPSLSRVFVDIVGSPL
ncbi:cyclin-D3-1 [Diospyros lotus]|uniref:cyclin-D3-1 n=1 Tax=Diospyros lotus TaxID=55363 RepID=UPI00225C2079|nr:cyclin-D3-1 [Diospyros lotus]